MSETSGVCAIVPRGQNDFRPRVFGMGILVGDREVVTCAHVVLYALGLGLRESPGAAGVRVCFPFANRFPCIDGTVERWFPTGRSTDGDVSDVAVIRLQKDAPRSVGRAVLREHVVDAKAKAYGFPGKERDGVWQNHPAGVYAVGTIRGQLPGGRAQFDGLRTGTRVQKGYSGGGVYDLDRDVVVGMVVESDLEKETKIAQFIDVPSLLRALGRPPESVAKATNDPYLGEIEYYPIPPQGLLRQVFDPVLEDRIQVFGGRDEELRTLAQFIESKDGGYLAVVAGPGFGKTALMATLVQGARREAFAYHFFDAPHPEWLTESFFLRNVVQQFARWHGRSDGRHGDEAVASLDDDRLKALYQEFLTEPLPQTRLLVLDGLDNVADWIGYYLSRRLPPRFHVLVTLRSDVAVTPDNEKLTAWIASRYRLPRDQTSVLPMAGLRQDEIARVLRMAARRAIEAPPAKLQDSGRLAQQLSEDETFLDKVMKVTADPGGQSSADPLFVRMLAEDLAEGNTSPEQIDQLPPGYAEGNTSPEQIDQLPLGYKKYLDQWWDEIVARTVERNGARQPTLERPVQDLLGTLVAARGPISRRELEEINPSLLDNFDKDYSLQFLKQIRRLILGDDRAGYTISHRRFQDYLRGRIRTEEYETKILTFCSKWRDNSSRYALANYVKHLALAGRTQELACVVTDTSFLEAKVASPDLGIDPLLGDLYLARDSVPASEQGRAVVIDLIAVLTREAHNLRMFDPGQRHVLFAQQLYNRATDLGFPGVAGLAAGRLRQRRQPYFRLRWRRGPVSRALKRVLLGHQVEVRAVAYVGPGGRVVSGAVDGRLLLWDLKTGTVTALVGHGDSVNAVAVPAVEPRVIVSGSSDGVVKVWDVETGKERCTLRGHQGPVTAVAVAPDGSRAASASDDNRVMIWDLNDGKPVRPLEGHQGAAVRAVALSADGRRAISGAVDRRLIVWDLETGEQVCALRGHDGWVTSAALSDDGLRAVSGSVDRTLRVWDLTTAGQEPLILNGHNGPVKALAVTSDFKRIVSVSLDRTVRVWDADRGGLLSTLMGHEGWVNAVAVNPRGTRAVSASVDGSIIVWDVEAPAAGLSQSPTHDDWVRGAAITRDGARAVSGCRDGKLIVWNLKSGEVVEALQGDDGWVSSVAVAAQGDRVVSGSHDGKLIVWDLKAGKRLQTLEGHDGWVNCVAITADGARAMSGSIDQTIRTWDLQTSGPARPELRSTGGVNALGLKPDGSLVVSGSDDNSLTVWDLTGRDPPTARPVGAPLEGHTEWVSAAAVTDGATALSGSKDHTIKVWDLGANKLIATLPGHTAGVNALAVSEGGAWAVSGGADRTLRLWCLNTKRELACVPLDSRVACVALGPDGRAVVAGDRSGNVYHLTIVWRGGAADAGPRPRPEEQGLPR